MASEPMQRGKQPVELERDHSSSIRTMHRHENSLHRFQDGNTSAQTQQLEYSGQDDNEGNGCCSILVSETTTKHEKMTHPESQTDLWHSALKILCGNSNN